MLIAYSSSHECVWEGGGGESHHARGSVPIKLQDTLKGAQQSPAQEKDKKIFPSPVSE